MMKMKFKKTFLIVCIIISIFFIAGVSAGDADNQTISSADDVEVSQIDDLKTSPENQIVGEKDDGTFKALNDKINGADEGSTVKLENNYSYEGTGFSEGIVISKDNIIIDGQGHTIDAQNQARIFKVQAENVTIKNITFKNGYATDRGGAVYWYMSSGGCVSGCNFIGNAAMYGAGAIWWHRSSGGCVSGCSFVNNIANANFGGAIIWDYSSGGSVSGCSFVNNTAASGGAIHWEGSSDCCVSDCSFVNNTASSGGAIRWDDSSGGCVSGCNFVNNIANVLFGGAIYWYGGGGYISLCSFTNNTASFGGGAIYSYYVEDVSVDSCIYRTGSDTAVNTLDFAPNLSVDNLTSSYLSGDKLTFDLKTNRSVPITNANITIEVYKNNELFGTYRCLSEDGWTVDLPIGSYCAIFNTEFAGFTPVNRTVTIKIPTEITSSDVSAVYDKNKYLTVVLRDYLGNPIADAEISINLNGLKTFKTDKNGQLKVNVAKLVPKTYAAEIIFNGKDDFYKSHKTVRVTVKKATPKLTAKKKTFKKSSKIKKYTVTLKSGKTPIKKVKLTLKIKGKTYKAKTNKKGKATFKIKKLTKKGKFKAVIKFKANKYYKKVTKKVKITIR